jgi:molybdate transport system substrate-binding protein
MKLHHIALAGAAIVLGCMSSRAQGTAPPAGEIRVLCSNGAKAALEQIKPQLQENIGHPLSFEFGTAASLNEKIKSGAAFDVAILTPELIDHLTTLAQIVPGTGIDISTTPVGIAVRAGAPKSDISTPEKLKQTLLAANSITYFKSGSIADVVTELFERLGISAEIKPKLFPQLQATHAAKAVAEGTAEVAVTLIREILSVDGVQFLGPIPQGLPGQVVLTAGVAAKSNDIESAKAVIKYLTGASAVSVLKANGMEPPNNK